MSGSLVWRGVAVVVTVVTLAACAQRGGKPTGPAGAAAGTTQVSAAVVCEAQQASSPLVGKWYSTSTPRGVGGQMHTLVTLRADGAMVYDTQLKIGKRMRPGLRETGCWTYVGNVLELHTLRSNGDAIDAGDPIYRNQWRVESANATRFVARDPRAPTQSLTARRMPDGFKLPTK